MTTEKCLLLSACALLIPASLLRNRLFPNIWLRVFKIWCQSFFQEWRAGCLGPRLSPTCCQNWPDMTVRWTFLYQEAPRSCKEGTSSEPWTRPLELEPSTRQAPLPMSSCQLHSLCLFLQLGISNTNTLFTRCTYLANLPKSPSNGLFWKMLILLSIFLKYTIVLPSVFYFVNENVLKFCKIFPLNFNYF